VDATEAYRAFLGREPGIAALMRSREFDRGRIFDSTLM